MASIKSVAIDLYQEIKSLEEKNDRDLEDFKRYSPKDQALLSEIMRRDVEMHQELIDVYQDYLKNPTKDKAIIIMEKYSKVFGSFALSAGKEMPKPFNPYPGEQPLDEEPVMNPTPIDPIIENPLMKPSPNSPINPIIENPLMKPSSINPFSASGDVIPEYNPMKEVGNTDVLDGVDSELVGELEDTPLEATEEELNDPRNKSLREWCEKYSLDVSGFEGSSYNIDTYLVTEPDFFKIASDLSLQPMISSSEPKGPKM